MIRIRATPMKPKTGFRQAHGGEWSRWELTQHEIEIPAAV
jgi:hypothetical protein